MAKVAGVVERGNARKAVASVAGTGRKRREPVPQPEKRPDLSGALTATVKDVSAYSRLSRSAICKAINRGDLRVVRVGRTVLVRVDSLHEMLGGPPAARLPGQQAHR